VNGEAGLLLAFEKVDTAWAEESILKVLPASREAYLEIIELEEFWETIGGVQPRPDYLHFCFRYVLLSDERRKLLENPAWAKPIQTGDKTFLIVCEDERGR